MRKITKGIPGLIILFLLWGVYLSIRTNQDETQLAEVSQPFIKACQSLQGCIEDPESLGWIKAEKYDNSCECDASKPKNKKVTYEYYKDGMIYNATSEKFTITWHIMTDTDLVATAGRNIPFSITTVYE